MFALKILKNARNLRRIPVSMCCESHTLVKKDLCLAPCILELNPHRTQLPVSFTFTRKYAKGKDKKKEKGKAKVEVNESQLKEILNIDSLKHQMERAINVMKEEFVKQLSLRSTTGSIENLQVDFEDKPHTLQELGQVIRKNPKTIVINMSTFPQAIPNVLKAIAKSGMNLNPQQDGTTLYVPIPKVTTEHRENLVKSAKLLFVKCKDSVKDVQNKQVKSLKRKDKVSEDLLRSAEQQIAVIAEGYIHQAEQILESKQKELTGKS